jgi:hypothetical protein
MQIMQRITRYAIKLKNGSFAKSDFFALEEKDDRQNIEAVKVESVDIAIDGDLHRTENEAMRCLKNMINDSGLLHVYFDSNNRPIDVAEIKIDFEYK